MLMWFWWLWQVFCNIGNPHAVQQKPITFFRQARGAGPKEPKLGVVGGLGGGTSRGETASCPFLWGLSQGGNNFISFSLTTSFLGTNLRRKQLKEEVFSLGVCLGNLIGTTHLSICWGHWQAAMLPLLSLLSFLAACLLCLTVPWLLCDARVQALLQRTS